MVKPVASPRLYRHVEVQLFTEKRKRKKKKKNENNQSRKQHTTTNDEKGPTPRSAKTTWSVASGVRGEGRDDPHTRTREGQEDAALRRTWLELPDHFAVWNAAVCRVGFAFCVPYC